MDIATLIQYGGPFAGMVGVLAYWLNETLRRNKELELLNSNLNDEVKQDLRDMLPILNDSAKLLKELGEDGNKEVLEHLKLIKDQITNVQCHAKEKDGRSPAKN